MTSFQRFLCLPGMEKFMENGRLTVDLDDDLLSASRWSEELIIPKISIGKKEDLPQALMKIIFLGKMAEYHDYIQVYTDGSKTETKCKCTVVIPSQSLSLSYCLPCNLTSFSAELMAIKFSLQAKQRSNIRSTLFALIYCQLWITSHTNNTKQEMLPLRFKIWLLNLQKRVYLFYSYGLQHTVV